MPNTSGNVDVESGGVSAAFYKLKGAALTKQLVDIKTSLTSEKLRELDSAALAIWLEQVERLEARFDSIQTRLEELDHEEMASGARSALFTIYLDVKAAITKEQNGRRAIETRQTSTSKQFSFDQSPSVVVAQPKMRLPLLQIPKFSGAYTDWPDFYSMFRTIVGNDADLTNVEKFQHLRSSLEDSALDAIRSFEINDENYKKALEVLVARFDNKRLNFQAHIREIFALKRVEAGSVVKLRELSDKVNAHLRAAQTMATKEQLADCMLIHLIGSKLDTASQTKWEEETSTNSIPTWDAMATFLEKRCRRLESVEIALVNQAPGYQVGRKPNQFTTNNRRALVASTAVCSFCELQEHAISQCRKFFDLSPSQRFKEVKRLQLCLNCLKKGHLAKTCAYGSCRHCSAKHHTLLHLTPRSQPATIDSNANIWQAQSALLSASAHTGISQPSASSSQNFVLLATAIVLVRNRAGSLVPARALLDSASQVHFVTTCFAQQLQLKKSKGTTFISGIGQSDFVADHIVDLEMHSRISDYSSSLSAVVTPNITDCQPNHSLHNIAWNIPSNISLADPQFFKSQRIDLLIGAGLFFELLCVGQIRLQKQLPLLQKTRLGWIVSGSGQSASNRHSCLASLKGKPNDETEYDLHELIKKFWEIENCFDMTSLATKEEMDCEAHFAQNFVRLESGEYSVRLPAKINPTQLGNSYQSALQRFKNLERKLQRNASLREQYSAFMKEYIDLKHMSLVGNLPVDTPSYFLPHHCVLKAESTTTKLRVVFDGSASTSSGYSLNDILMTGPTIQPKLFDTLLRFRSFKIALTADICKMYRCVRVSEPDNFLQCILWRDDPNDPIQIYKLDTVTYGTKPASFLAIRAMHQLASDEELTHPLGAQTVRRDFYVDDMISGGDSVQEVLNIMKQTSSLLAKGNFMLRKWCSNDVDVLNATPKSEREQFLRFHDGSQVTKTLGLVWDPNSDNFLFSFKPFAPNKRTTKRTVLSVIARFYDPLGLIGPVITKTKIFIQLLWKEKLHWDESLPQELNNDWLGICNGFQVVDKFSFERFVRTTNANLQVHAFCDARLSAYGACIYIRAEHFGNIKTTLLCSKSRVAPLKTLTVPKLELCAASLLAVLVNGIASLNIFGCNFYCWSDSTIVLSWLRDEPSNYNVFVSNRVSSIQALTKGMSWHHVPTEMNPADILSRGASPRELLESTLWKCGPTFLQRSHDLWPITPTIVRDLTERRKTALLSTAGVLDLSTTCKFINSFGKIQRVYAYVNRFCRAIGGRESNLPGSLCTKDIQQGTYLLIRMIQMVHLAAEYKALASKKDISASSDLYSLKPFIDDYGLLRVGGRLQNSVLDFEAKHPIILPKQHALTKSIIVHFHRKMLHAGPQAVLATIRLHYWPIGGRKNVAKVLNKCIQCFRVKPKTTEHLMGNLPLERVQANRAFAVTGMDFCGPFFYRSEIRNKSPIKCYVCLFICFSTKAVHLELVNDLSTPSFLASLKRFICTRGKPKTLWSDNATNFVGAKNELAELKRLFLNDENLRAIHQQCLEDGIDWRFIPPRSPHFGGLWEASIKIAKFHFWRVVGLSIWSFDELRNLICQISAIMNSRPLCPLTENPDDLDVLTPAHFLIGTAFTSIVEPDISTLNINRLDRWQRVCYIQQLFWKKWSAEYLTLLQQRSKWRSSKPNIRVGTMVLVKDENLPPLKWPLARVIDTIKGDDGVVRVAVIRTHSGTCRRAVSKLCILPLEDDTVESLRLPTGGGCSEKQ